MSCLTWLADTKVKPSFALHPLNTYINKRMQEIRNRHEYIIFIKIRFHTKFVESYGEQW